MALKIEKDASALNDLFCNNVDLVIIKWVRKQEIIRDESIDLHVSLHGS